MKKRNMPMLNSRQKKKQIFLSLCVILISLLAISWGIEHTGKYFSWEKAAAEELRLRGFAPPEEYLLIRDGTEEVHGGLFTEEWPERYVVTKVGRNETESYIIAIQLLKNEFVWEPVRFDAEWYNAELQAWYQEDMEMMLGSCQNPNITEVTMKWGHWIETEDGWETYVMGEDSYPLDENGFFYQEVDVSKAQYETKDLMDGGKEERRRLIQTVYIEGRDKDGNILYRNGMDEEGRRWTSNGEVK